MHISYLGDAVINQPCSGPRRFEPSPPGRPPLVQNALLLDPPAPLPVRDRGYRRRWAVALGTLVGCGVLVAGAADVTRHLVS